MLSNLFRQLPWQGFSKHDIKKIGLVYLILMLPAIGFVLGLSSINAMLIKRLGVQYMPYSYITLASCNIFGTFFFLQYADKISRLKLLGILAGCAGPILLFARFLAPTMAVDITGFTWGLLAFFGLTYLVHGFFTSALNVQALSLLNDIFRPSQRNRLFAFFSSAWVIGGMTGGFLIRLLVPLVGVVNIIPLWGCLYLCIIPLAWVFHRNYAGELRWSPPARDAKNKGHQLDQLKDAFRYIKSSKILWYIVAMPLLYNIVNAMQDYQFSQVMNASYDTEAALTQFFGSYTILWNVTAIILQLTIASKALLWIGIFRGFFVLPAVTLLAFVFLLVNFGFWEGLWLRYGWNILSVTIYFNAIQHSYSVIPQNFRGRIRGFNSGIVNSIGTVCGALILIIFHLVFMAGTFWQHIIPTLGGIACCAIWLYVVMRGRGVYIQTLISNLYQKDYNTRAEALESMEERREPVIHEALNSILLNPEESGNIKIKSKAMKVLSRLSNSDSLRTLSLFLKDPEPQLRLNAIKAISLFKKISNYPFALHYLMSEIQEIFQHDPSHHVRIEAGRFLLNFLPKDEQPKFIEEILNHADRSIRIMAIQNIDLLNIELIDMMVIGKLNDPDVAVRSEAIMALWKFTNYRLITSAAIRRLLQSQDTEEVKYGLITLIRLGTPAEYLMEVQPLVAIKNHLIKSLACIFCLSSLSPGTEEWQAMQNALIETLADPSYPEADRKQFVGYIPKFKDEAIDAILEGLQELSMEKRAIATAGIENFAELLYKKIINES